jgi:hypothetical protein
MASPVVSSAFVRLLDDRLREVADKRYNELPTMIPEIFSVLKSEKAWEEFYNVVGPGDVPEFTGKLTYLEVHPGFHRKIEHKEYAAGMAFQRKFLDDKRYSVLDDGVGMLMESAQRTREKQGVRAFAYGDSTAYDYMTTNEENVALFSDSHTTKAGVSTSSGFDNLGTSSMTKTTIAATRILMRKFKADNGQRIDMPDDFALIVPDDLADTANEIIGTPSGYETSASTKNMDYQRYRVIPWMRLSDHDTNDWYMVCVSKMKRDLVWFDRVLPETNMTIDFDTFQVKDSVYFRNSYGFKDWRWGYKHVAS